jgi:L-threonine kinase
VNSPTLVARRPGVDVRSGKGEAFGTFGELLQGRLPDGTDFLVTFPITRRSQVWFRFDPAGPLRVFPSHKVKSLRLAESMLAVHGSGAGGILIVDSDLLIGKGLASSSADLVATARAIGGVLGLDTAPEAVEGWLRPIEPTDGVMHHGIVVFEHRVVRLRQVLGTLPSTTVVAVDEGGLLDTVQFNRRPKHFAESQAAEYAVLLADLTEAVRAADLAAVGAVASRSAVLNQRFAPKQNLDAMMRLAGETGALGVVCAHSGTMLGLLFDDADRDLRSKVQAARVACSMLPGSTLSFRAVTY